MEGGGINRKLLVHDPALLGLADQIGTLESGKLADVIVVDGNPAEDITVLRDPDHITMVMQAGHMVKGGGRTC